MSLHTLAFLMFVFSFLPITPCRAGNADMDITSHKIYTPTSIVTWSNADKRVRDDINSYINSLPDTQMQKQALHQDYVALANALKIDLADKKSLIEATTKISNAVTCIHTRYNTLTASRKTTAIEKITINTKERFLAYEKFNTAIGGMSFVLPEVNGCTE